MSLKLYEVYVHLELVVVKGNSGIGVTRELAHALQIENYYGAITLRNFWIGTFFLALSASLKIRPEYLLNKYHLYVT